MTTDFASISAPDSASRAKRMGAEIDRRHIVHPHLGSKVLRLLLHRLDESRRVRSWIARVVLHIERERELPADFAPRQQQRVQLRPPGVESRRVTRRSRADDDNVPLFDAHIFASTAFVDTICVSIPSSFGLYPSASATSCETCSVGRSMEPASLPSC